jgi:SAM-dependent methyltransferase
MTNRGDKGFWQMTTIPYDENYFRSHCGLPYTRDEPHWALFFGMVARQIDEKLSPTTVFDAGCAIGFLVEAFRARGIAAFGRDFSEYAIAQVPVGLAPFCECGSIADPIPGDFSLVTCIEVLEHMTEIDGRQAISNLCKASSRVLFSSSPTDFNEITHINVRPPIHWMELFAEEGFAPRADFDGTFLCPWAILFERRDEKPTNHELNAQSRLVLTRMEMAQRASSMTNEITGLSARFDAFEAAISMHLTHQGQEFGEHRVVISEVRQLLAAFNARTVSDN